LQGKDVARAKNHILYIKEETKMAEFASNGKANAALTTGIIGTAGVGMSLLNGGLGNLFGGWGCNNGAGNAPVNRYEAQQQARIAELETEVKLRDSNIYTDQKILEVYKYFDGETKDIRNVLAAQAVMNQKTADSFDMVRNDILCCKNELYSAIARERDERCCGDNAIVNYANNTFYPKMVADVTTGTTTTAQSLYNPLPNCGNRCCG
jgi:hypothetical protein